MLRDVGDEIYVADHNILAYIVDVGNSEPPFRLTDSGNSVSTFKICRWLQYILGFNCSSSQHVASSVELVPGSYDTTIVGMVLNIFQS